ncbi:hypothetical protein ACH5RR_035319 [Cinchona calisaya]|uniref:Uncharacterized protein n=1 Tax=Cinchona calisaya TaxID=153742 RepID=A0ABD2YEK9_9GENT
MRYGTSLLALLINACFPPSSGESYGAAIWQIPELYGQMNSPQLEQIAALDGHDSKIKSALWWPTGRHDKLVSIDEQNLFLWNLHTSKKSAQVLVQNLGSS